MLERYSPQSEVLLVLFHHRSPAMRNASGYPAEKYRFFHNIPLFFAAYSQI